MGIRTVDHYDVRYNTILIDSSNFPNSTNAGTPPTPEIAGSSQEMKVAGLTPGLEYFFAVQSYDEVGNISSISKNSSAIAYQVPLPDLIVSRVSVSPNVATPGQSIHFSFTVKMSGNQTWCPISPRNPTI